MNRAALAAIVGLVAVAAVAAAVVLGGGDNDASGTEAGGGGRLAWAATPEVVTPERLPRDRILVGDVRNDTLREVDVRATKDVRLLDTEGRALPHTTIFTEGFGRDIYPPRYRRAVPLQDQLRLGLRAKIRPGDTVPITVAWRVRRGGADATTLRLPGGDLKVPSPD